MFKILIVDDNPWVHEGLLKSIPWEKLGVEVAGAATDGDTALELYKKTIPDIVLTDIKMPVMNGLELSEAISRINTDTYIILMSAYDEFEYARKALEVNAKIYILKPFGKEEIIPLVKKACNEITELRKKRRVLEEGSLYIKELLLKTLITSTLDDPDKFLSKCSNIGLNLYGKQIIVYVLRADIDEIYLDNSDYSDSTNNIGSNYIKQNIIEIIQSNLYENSEGIVSFTVNNNLIIGFMGFNYPYNKNTIKKVFMHTCKEISEIYKIQVAVGISNVYNSVTKAYEGYIEAVTALNYTIISQKVQVLCFSEIHPISSIHNNDLFAYQQKIEHVIKAGVTEEIKSIVEELDQVVLHTGILHHFGSKDIMQQFAKIPIRILVEYGYSVEDVFGRRYIISDYINQIETFEEFKVWFTRFILSVANLINIDTIDNRKDIELAKEYINNNYSKSITLQNVSETFMFSSCYFSKLFKKEAGMTFIRYLTEVRINKAKELLNDYSLKIYDISYMVGYSNVKHFVSLFKKNMGVTPSEYRKKICWRNPQS